MRGIGTGGSRRRRRQPPPPPPPAPHHPYDTRLQRRRRGHPTGADGATDMVGLIPDDVIVSNILSRLDLTSFVRAAAVSKPWRALARLSPPPAAAAFPWLLGNIEFDYPPSLFRLIPPTIHHPRPPPVWVVPPVFQYVGVVDGHAIITPEISCDTSLALYNPFSGEARQLVPDAEIVRPVDELRFQIVRVLPERGLVVAVRGRLHSVYTYVLTQPGADWVFSNLNGISDLIFYKDSLYCASKGGKMYAFCVEDLLTDASHAQPKTVYGQGRLDHSFRFCIFHLVESSGDLLAFTWKFFMSGRRKHEFEGVLEKMELDEQGKVVSLVRVKDLGDRLLLIDRISGSVSCSDPADPSGLFNKNCVYVIHHISFGSKVSIAKLILTGGEKETFVVYPPQIPQFRDWPVWITPNLGSFRMLGSRLTVLWWILLLEEHFDMDLDKIS